MLIKLTERKKQIDFVFNCILLSSLLWEVVGKLKCKHNKDKRTNNSINLWN